ITEGCVREYRGKNGVSKNVGFCSAEKEIQDDFTESIYKMECDVRWDGIDARVINSNKNKGKHNKNHVYDMLKEYGVWNKLSYEKTIPDFIFKLSKKQIALFLKVLFTCDGWINKGKYKQIGFAVANEKLSRQVQSLLTRFGIVSKLRFAKNDKRGSWTVTIADDENIRKYCQKIGFLFSKEDKMKEILQGYGSNYSFKSFLDKFPYQIASRFYDEVKHELGGGQRIEYGMNSIKSKFHTVLSKAGTIREQIAKKAPLMRQSFIEVKDTKTGQGYFNSPILWDEILRIEYIGKKETYDLTIDKYHNFIAENILVHNTFWLLDISMRAITKKANVAFFQAGDMTKHQQLKRICIHLAKKSDKEKYCGKLTIPVKDCLLNQADLCDRPEREENDKLKGFPIRDMANGAYEVRKNLDMDTLVNFYHKYPDYIPCYNCKEWKYNGSVWLKEHNTGPELKAPEAKKVLQNFFKKYKRRFKLSTHANQTLTVKEIQNILNTWEKEDGFVPDLIVIDYADIVLPNNPRLEFRHQQNSVWMAMRGLSQERHCLVVTATQADAASYDQDTLNLKNFSEDKRKYAHATAIYGLNQDKKGREKKMGLMRINELVVREDDFNVSNQVYVMQKLQMGRPFLGSFK
ncbi:MAG TPA: LAGLIDADG family homing endonuclease, partial [Bacteroidales bacterium]|nr:LAGLIDADG family homing endonuclease [Bacteroidales bacterium]